MTHTSDQLRQGNAYYVRQFSWNAGVNTTGLPTSGPNNMQNLGAVHTQTVCYQVGTASTALASGIFYASSAVAGTLTATGVFVSASTATLDVVRGIRVSASSNLSTVTFTFVGTDGYGSAQTHSFIGPSGNTLGTVGAYTDSLVTFKTITSASSSGAATSALTIGTNDCYGLPYRVTNAGKGLDAYINGSSATVPATWVAGATGPITASTPDVRGTVTLATGLLANDSRYITMQFIAPAVGISENLDTKENTYGLAPFGS